MLYRTQNPHGGDVYGAEVAFDFSSNVNPLGTPPNVLAAISHAALHVRQYPDPYCRALTAAIAAHEAVPEDFILCGAGAAELIYVYCDALRPKKAMELAPTFLEYSAAASHFGAEVVRVPLRSPEFLPDSKILDKLREEAPDVLFLCTPNNPTGQTIGRSLLQSVLDISLAQGTRVLLDECFLDFTDEKSAKDLLSRYENLLIVKAFTKSYAAGRSSRGLLPDGRYAPAFPNGRVLAAVERLASGAGGGRRRAAKPRLGFRGEGTCFRAAGISHKGAAIAQAYRLPVEGQLSAVPCAGRAGRGSAARKNRHPQLRELPRALSRLVPRRCAAGERK